MRKPDENKRRQIVTAAAKLFSMLPYHKVLLEQVATDAQVGKGTVYIYFKDKENLYYSMISEGFAKLVQRLQQQLAAKQAHFAQRVRAIVAGLVEFGLQHPELFEVMRSVGVPPEDTAWDNKRKELANLIEQVVRDGVSSGECGDEHPELIGLYIPAMVRAALLYGNPGDNGLMLTEHITKVLTHSLVLRPELTKETVCG